MIKCLILGLIIDRKWSWFKNKIKSAIGKPYDKESVINQKSLSLKSSSEIFKVPTMEIEFSLWSKRVSDLEVVKSLIGSKVMPDLKKIALIF